MPYHWTAHGMPCRTHCWIQMVPNQIGGVRIFTWTPMGLDATLSGSRYSALYHTFSNQFWEVIALPNLTNLLLYFWSLWAMRSTHHLFWYLPSAIIFLSSRKKCWFLKFLLTTHFDDCTGQTSKRAVDGKIIIVGKKPLTWFLHCTSETKPGCKAPNPSLQSITGSK